MMIPRILRHTSALYIMFPFELALEHQFEH